MKTKAINLLLAIFLVALSNCTTPTKENTQAIKLDFTLEPISIHDIGLIEDVQVLSLDCEEALFGEISRIIKHENRIYLMDKWMSNSVIIYDTLGNFINQISKKGEGPDEYLQLTDIVVDSHLYIISRMDQKMLKYDLDGKQLISVEKLPRAFSSFFKMQDGYIGYLGNYKQQADDKNVWTLSEKLKLENSYIDMDPTWESRMLGGGYVFSSYQDKTYYIEPLNFTIYAIGQDGITQPYTFDLGNLAWPQNAKTQEQYDHLGNQDRDPYISRFYNFQETANHLIVETTYKGQNLFGIYNKENGQAHIAKPDVYVGKYFLGFGTIIGYDQNAIYALKDASEIKSVMRKGKDEYGNDFEADHPEQIKRMRQDFGHLNLTEDSNPFLIIYKIR